MAAQQCAVMRVIVAGAVALSLVSTSTASPRATRGTTVGSLAQFHAWLLNDQRRPQIATQADLGATAGLEAQAASVAAISLQARQILGQAQGPVAVRWNKAAQRIELSAPGQALRTIDLQGLATPAEGSQAQLAPLAGMLQQTEDPGAWAGILDRFYEKAQNSAGETLADAVALGGGKKISPLGRSQGRRAKAPRTSPPSPWSADDQKAMREQRRKLLEWEQSPRKTLVSLHSQSFSFDTGVIGIETYDTRNLAQILAAADPNVNVIFITATPVEDAMIQHVLRGRPDADEIRKRVHFVALEDASAPFLAEKVMLPRHAAKRQRVKDLIAAIGAPAMLYPYISTPYEWEAADELGIANAVYGPHPSLQSWNSKSGNRKIFKRAAAKLAKIGIRVTDGAEDLYDFDALMKAADGMRARNPNLTRIAVKFNAGTSGSGNVYPSLLQSRERIREQLADFKVGGAKSILELMSLQGAVVEEYIEGIDRASFPSGQAEVWTDGSVRLLSTHEQILLDGNIYMGAHFPAHAKYRKMIEQATLAVAEELAKEGIYGRLGVDFAAVPRLDGSGGMDVYAIEINVRVGGTTHPYVAATGLTEAQYDEHGLLRMPDGRELRYKSLDHDVRERLVGLEVAPFLEFFERPGHNDILMDPKTRNGVLFHLLKAVKPKGNVGYTIIADSEAEIPRIQERLTQLLDKLEDEHQGAGK